MKTLFSKFGIRFLLLYLLWKKNNIFYLFFSPILLKKYHYCVREQRYVTKRETRSKYHLKYSGFKAVVALEQNYYFIHFIFKKKISSLTLILKYFQQIFDVTFIVIV